MWPATSPRVWMLYASLAASVTMATSAFAVEGAADARSKGKSRLRSTTPLQAVTSGDGGAAMTSGDGGAAGAPGTACDGCPVREISCPTSFDAEIGNDACVLLQTGFLTDLWRFELTEPKQVTVEIQSTQLDSYVSLLNESCLSILENDDCSPNDFTRSCLFVALPAGTYFIAVDGFGVQGAYTLQLDCAEVSSACDDCVVGTLPCGKTVRGSLATNDCVGPGEKFEDIFRLDLPESGRLTVNLSSATVDTVVELLDENCLFIAQNDDCGELSNSCLAADLEAGSYHVKVSSFFDREVGTYDLSASCQPGFDTCTDCLAGTLSCGETLRGDFQQTNCLDDVGLLLDIYSFRLEEAGLVSLFATSDEFDAALSLLDANCDPIRLGSFCGDFFSDGCIQNVELDAGTYHIGLTNFFAQETGSFTLEVVCPDLGPCRDCTVGTIDCASPAQGSLSDGDCLGEDGSFMDLWRFENNQEQSLTLQLAGGGPTTSIALLDVTCTPVDTGTPCEADSDDCLTFRQLPAGVYYVVAKSVEPVASYEIEADCSTFEFCRDCALDELRDGNPLKGELEDGDCLDPNGFLVDVYPVTLAKPGRLQVDMTSLSFNPFLILFDEQCSAINFNDDCGFDTNSCLVADLPPGDYFVGASSSLGETGSYDIGVSLGEIPNCQDCIVGPVTCNQPIQATLPTGNCTLQDGRAIDYYQLTVARASRVDISLHSLDLDTVLFLYDETCVPFRSNDDCSFATVDSCLSLELDEGTYFVGASSFSFGFSGSYTLEVSGDGCNLCTSCTPDAIKCDDPVEGTLGPESCTTPEGLALETWQFSLLETSSVRFDLEATGFDPVVRIFDDSCLEIATNDDCDRTSLASCLDVNLSPGTYTIGASSFLPDATGNYRLSMQCDAGGLALPGDCNFDNTIDLSDPVCILRALFSGGTLPCGPGGTGNAGNLTLLDFNGSGDVALTDSVAFLNFLFRGNAPHALGRDCVRVAGCPPRCE